MARGLFAVLEDEFSEVVGVPTEQQEQVQELEAQVGEAEVAQDQQEVDQMAATADEAVAAIEELAEVADVVEDSVEEGEGLSEDAAEIAEVAVESICARLGYKPAKKPMPALEAFGATSSRLDATRYALEGISETIRNIWTAIKNFFSTIWEKIKGFWNRLFDQATRLKARADSLDKKVDEAISGGLVVNAEKKLNLTSFCQAFNAKAAGELEKGITSTLGAQVALAKLVGAGNDAIVKQLETVAKAEKLADLEGIETAKLDFSSIKGTLAFGYKLETKDNAVALVETKIKLDKVEGLAVEAKDLKTVIGNAKGLVEQIEAGKKDFAKAEKVVKQGIALADKLSKATEGAAEAQAKAKAFRENQALFVLLNTKGQSLGLKAAGAALGYVATNLGGLKKAA